MKGVINIMAHGGARGRDGGQHVSMRERRHKGLRDVCYKKTGKCGKKNRGGLPKSHFFCNLTKWFLACQIHSEVLKHVLQVFKITKDGDGWLLDDA